MKITMRHNLFLWLTIFAFTPSLTLAGDLPKHTAEYYEAMQDRFIDQEVTVKVAEVKANTLYDNAFQNHRVLSAYTYHKGKSGGWINVIVPSEDVPRVINRFGTSGEFDGNSDYRTKTLRGFLKKSASGELFIMYSP